MRWITFSLLSLLLMSPGLRAEDAPAAATTDTASAAPAAETSDAATTETATATDNAATSSDETASTEASASDASPAPEAASTEEGNTEAASADASATGSAAPMDTERVIVSSVAGAVALAGLATGITFGVMALNEYNCLNDVVNCNKNMDTPIEGSAYLDAKESVERNALYADMGYLVAATAATVAIVGAVELLFGSDAEVAE